MIRVLMLAAAAVLLADADLSAQSRQVALDTTIDRVEAYDFNLHSLYLIGGVDYEIRLRGDGDTDLDCFLYDENGNLILSDIRIVDSCVLYITPLWSGPFELEVSNLGFVWNRYRLTLR